MIDLMDDANEINDILGEAWGMDDIDEDELLDGLCAAFVCNFCVLLLVYKHTIVFELRFSVTIHTTKMHRIRWVRR